MKKLLIIPAVLLASLCGSPVAAADFQKGLEAYAKQDYATALRTFTALAEQGDAKAQGILGLMYAKGEGVPQDDRQAVQWYTRAAEQGYAPAQINLGLMYAKGKGVPQDARQAVQWFIRAAVQWFTGAAEQGNAPAE